MPTDPLFRMTVEDVFMIRGRGTVVVGKVESGTLHTGDEIFINGQAGTKKAAVGGLEMFHKLLQDANPGDNVGVLLKDVTRDDVRRGDVLTGSGMDFSWKP